jgi:trk system potassium uptake protein TrkH
LIIAVLALALIIEAAGAAVLLPMWDGDTDANFADGGDRVLTSVFHAVSAFCNTGLTLTRESMVGYRDERRLYAAILPLMVLGSIGGPVLVELIRRLIRRRGLGLGSLSYHSELTLAGSVMLIVVVAGLLIGIESTPTWQLRNPREDTPGRLMLPNATTQTATMPLATTRLQERIRTQRLATMDWPSRVKAAVLLSASARTTGMRTVRLDEASVSPAGRFVLMGAMLIGGGVGGTAGGLRLGVFLLLIGALRFAWGSSGTPRDTTANRQPVLVIAGGLATALVLLVGLTGFALAYRETGSPLACAFEAMSACCNVGFSTGLTSQLSTQGRVVVMLAMLLGRVIPLAFLLRFLRVPLIPPALAPEPAVEADQPIPADNNTEVPQST